MVGTTKGLVLIGSKTLSVFRSAFLRRKSIFDQLRLEKRSRPEERVPQFLTSQVPQMGMKEGHFGLSLQKAGVAHGVKFPLEDVSY